MPDISMCKNEDCEIKESCHRFTAIPDIYQSFCDFSPYLKNNKTKCDYFINNEYHKKNESIRNK